MKKVVFTQDIGVQRKIIESLLAKQNLIADWAIADGLQVEDSDNVVAISTAFTPLPDETLKQFKNLRVVSMSFTGYDHVDKTYCLNNNIAVYNVPAYSTDSVVELAIGLGISLLRQIPKGDSEIRNGNWNEAIQCFELANKKCGVIGTGTIGCRLSELLSAFKCELFGWSRTEKKHFIDIGGSYCSLHELIQKCDLIFVTIALNEETKDLLSHREFDLINKNAYVINVARGPIVNRKALIEAINNNKIAGAALDVYDYEPLSADDEIRLLKKSILTPHIAYKTKEALERKASTTIENVFRGLNNDSENRVI